MSKTRCHHICSCGAELTCGDADRCGAGAFWTCFTCEMDHYDDYMSRREAELDHINATRITEDDTNKELTHR